MNHSDALPRVPNRSTMPMGMRLMHETYLFIYLMGACLGGLVSYSCNNYTSSGIRSSYTNLLTILTEPNGENPPKHNYSQLPMGMLKGNDLSIVDITERAVQISNKHW